MTKLACDSKSSSCHSLSLWQCLVVYLLEFKNIFINKTMDILNKFTFPSLVSIKQVVLKTATVYISRQRIKIHFISKTKYFKKLKFIPNKNFLIYVIYIVLSVSVQTKILNEETVMLANYT